MCENRQEDKKNLRHTLRAGAEKKLLGLLGLASRARRLVTGTDLCRDAVRRGQLILVIVASDASANTADRITNACLYYDTDWCQVPIPSSVLSKQIGKTANVAVIGITDVNFANGIAALFDEE